GDGEVTEVVDAAAPEDRVRAADGDVGAVVVDVAVVDGEPAAVGDAAAAGERVLVHLRAVRGVARHGGVGEEDVTLLDVDAARGVVLAVLNGESRQGQAGAIR